MVSAWRLSGLLSQMVLCCGSVVGGGPAGNRTCDAEVRLKALVSFASFKNRFAIYQSSLSWCVTSSMKRRVPQKSTGYDMSFWLRLPTT